MDSKPTWVRVDYASWVTPGTDLFYALGYYRLCHPFGEVEVRRQSDGHWYCTVTTLRYGAPSIVQGDRAEVLWATAEEAVRAAQVWLTENDARRRLGG